MEQQELMDAIDHMTYEELLRKNRFEPVGSKWFSGEVGDYFVKTMNRKREALLPGEHSRISKKIGWG